MNKQARLVLADGSVYEGFSFGGDADTFGEVVFNTSMIGYQEMLTDPSYAGQILVPTYPLIGNYGINAQDDETDRIQVRGFVVREECLQPSHYLNKKTIHQYLLDGGISGIYGLDTRSITRKLRSVGVMMGMITSSLTPAQALAELKNKPDYGLADYVKEVSTKKSYIWEKEKSIDFKYNVVAYDCGLKVQHSATLESARMQGDGDALHLYGGRDFEIKPRRHFTLTRSRRPRESWIMP